MMAASSGTGGLSPENPVQTAPRSSVNFRPASLVCGGIDMSDIPSMPYRLLWGERRVVSVANLTRSDGAEFFSIGKAAGVRCFTSVYPLEHANEALDDLRAGRVSGAAVIVP
ncbi:medium-chain dehydrogenase/reductase MDR family protein (plasmid) [Rhizobium phaseoli]|nr:medium-chain dehydrogenase/reductase MDR family protein [Rhizobium phaseoli]ANL62483.1 medium-chain dehydrogenase/reductase MDR family protein [Rhizobium phaseoli]